MYQPQVFTLSCLSDYHLEDTTYQDLTGQVVKAEDRYFAYGGFADIWKGKMVKNLKDPNDVTFVRI